PRIFNRHDRGPAVDDAAPHHRAAAQYLLSKYWRAVHAHGRSASPPLAARTNGGEREPHYAAAQRAIAHFAWPDERCRVRRIYSAPFPWGEKLLARRSRNADSTITFGGGKSGRAQNRRNCASDGTPRPAKCAGERNGQKCPTNLPRICRYRP